MDIKDDYIITKRNILNELGANKMTLQELRFFSIYLSKINPFDISTRVVRFELSDFQKIMNLSKLNVNQLKNTTNSLLSKIVDIPNERGGYTAFQLFKKCTLDINKNNEWFIEFDAHDDALPLMFEFKNNFFTYKLWNALQCKSVNQIRMYEILKQYEKIGERILSIEELRYLLGIEKDKYLLFQNFKVRVLDACKKGLDKYTDIRFDYVAYGKKGVGGKILKIKFFIYRNKNFVDLLNLENFIKTDDNEENNWIINDNLEFLSDSCENEFSIDEILLLYGLIIKIIPFTYEYDNNSYSIVLYDYLKSKYHELNWRSKQNKIRHRFNYLKKLIELDLNNIE